MGMRARVKQYSIIVCTREKKAKGRTKLEQEQIWNGFKGFPKFHSKCVGTSSPVTLFSSACDLIFLLFYLAHQCMTLQPCPMNDK